MQLRMRGHLDPVINLLICHTQLMETVVRWGGGGGGRVLLGQGKMETV